MQHKILQLTGNLVVRPSTALSRLTELLATGSIREFALVLACHASKRGT